MIVTTPLSPILRKPFISAQELGFSSAGAINSGILASSLQAKKLNPNTIPPPAAALTLMNERLLVSIFLVMIYGLEEVAVMNS